MDYGPVSTILPFAECQRRDCVNITIQNDEEPEQLESFLVSLVGRPDLDGRITLNPVEGEVVIIDANGMYEFYVYFKYHACKITLCSCCCWSRGDLLPGLRGCGCGRAMCYCVFAKYCLSSNNSLQC